MSGESIQELNIIINNFNKLKDSPGNKINRDLVYEWMKSEEIESLGALYSFCTNPIYYSKIDPNLTSDDYYNFIRLYFKRCLVENPFGDWADTRYEAGWSLVNWFRTFWNDKSISNEYVYGLKKWLEDIYISGDNDIRVCIITAVLEHLFDDKKIVNFFSDWKNETILNQAFNEALGVAGEIQGP